MEKLETAVRQEQISQAVLRIIAEKGLEGVRVSAVAREIGVVPSALYRHFACKEKMVLAALDSVRQKVSEVFETLERRATTPLAWLDTLVTVVPSMFEETVVIPRVVFGTSAGATQQRVLKYVAENLHQPLIDRITARIVAAQQAGQIKPGLDPQTLCLMYFGLYMTAMIRWYVTQGGIDPGAYVKDAWAILRAGIVVEGVNHA